MAGKFSIYKYVRLEGKGWRYARAAYHPNGKIKPNVVLVKGVNGSATEEKHTEGSYFLNFNNTWIPVGADALEAQHKRKVKLNQVEHERLSGKTAARGPNLVQLGRKVIKDEVDAYPANLELAKRPYKTVGEKRRFLSSFLRIVSKKFVDEFSRNDVLTFRNELMVDYDPEYVGKQMISVVTFFNQWLRLKLNIQKCDWPEHEQNPPEPYIDAEIVALETHTKGKTNLMVRLFRSTGCRDMEVAHLTDTDISPRTKEILIRQKPCFHCKECISRGKSIAGNCAVLAYEHDEEGALDGAQLISAESDPEVQREQGIFIFINGNFAAFLGYLRNLSLRDQELLLAYYSLRKTQTQLAPIFRTSQTLCSAAMRAAVRAMCAYIAFGGQPTEERMRPILQAEGLEEAKLQGVRPRRYKEDHEYVTNPINVSSDTSQEPASNPPTAGS